MMEFKTAQEGRRAAVLPQLEAAYGPDKLRAVKERWWRDPKREVDDWTRTYMTKSQEFLNLPSDPTLWPKPAALQTAWATIAYFVASIVRNVGDGRRIGEGDAYDAHHYSAAWYADLFVTDDAACLETCAMIPTTRPIVEGFDVFVERRLNVARG